MFRLFGQRQRRASAAAGLGHLLEADLARGHQRHLRQGEEGVEHDQPGDDQQRDHGWPSSGTPWRPAAGEAVPEGGLGEGGGGSSIRSEEHTSELQSLMRISYAVFCLKKKKNKT